MTCREFIDYLQAFLEKELSREEMNVMEAHLRACPQCVDYLDSYRRTIELERCCGCDDDSMIEEAPEELVRAILEARRKTS